MLQYWSFCTDFVSAGALTQSSSQSKNLQIWFDENKWSGIRSFKNAAQKLWNNLLVSTWQAILRALRLWLKAHRFSEFLLLIFFYLSTSSLSPPPLLFLLSPAKHIFQIQSKWGAEQVDINSDIIGLQINCSITNVYHFLSGCVCMFVCCIEHGCGLTLPRQLASRKSGTCVEWLLDSASFMMMGGGKMCPPSLKRKHQFF